MKIYIPEYVKKAIEALTAGGFEAFAVGGAIRDTLLGITPDDWDITTNALADDVKALFAKHFDTGIKHGTITVLVDNKPIEITTYRIESEYESNRRPKSVEFTSSLEEDLKRRDFTINAMAYNESKGLVDLFGGADDLENGIIRCVGDPHTRFNEDALRMMRAVRFAARLGFTIEENTFKSIVKNFKLLENISSERIQSELIKTLTASNNINLLFASEITKVIAPEITEYNLNLINSVPLETESRLAAFLFNTNANTASEFLNKLKFDNKTKNIVLKILRGVKEPMPADDVEMRRLLCSYGENTIKKIIGLWQFVSIDEASVTKKLFEANKHHPHSLQMLDIDGNDLISLGVRGKYIGTMMNLLLEMVIKNPEINSFDKLKSIVENINNDNRYQI